MNKFLAWMLLCLSPWLAAGTQAGTTEPSASARNPIWLAQLSPEERRRLHERWEHASPAERAAVREELRERWRDVPPEQRELQRQQLIEGLRPMPPRDRDFPREQSMQPMPERPQPAGFGAGFEQRRIEREGPGRQPGGRR